MVNVIFPFLVNLILPPSEYKEWYYTKAKELGSTIELENNIDSYRPKKIKELYELAHKQ